MSDNSFVAKAYRCTKELPVPTQCNREQFGFSRVENRRFEADFGGGAMTSDAGALLRGAADRAVRHPLRRALHTGHGLKMFNRPPSHEIPGSPA